MVFVSLSIVVVPVQASACPGTTPSAAAVSHTRLVAGGGAARAAPLAEGLARAFPATLNSLPDRDEAREKARKELARAEYRAQRPRLWQRLLTWFLELLTSFPVPSGPWSAWALGLVVVGLMALGAFGWRAFVLPRRVAGGSRADDIFDKGPSTAADHRELALRATQQQDWHTAVLEYFRALMRQVEERGLLMPRPGRTADEAAQEAGDLLPDLRPALLSAARTFDDVRYGEQPATETMQARLREVDDALRSARPLTATAPNAPSAPAAPTAVSP